MVGLLQKNLAADHEHAASDWTLIPTPLFGHADRSERNGVEIMARNRFLRARNINSTINLSPSAKIHLQGALSNYKLLKQHTFLLQK